MAVFTRPRTHVPDDLEKFDARRWIRLSLVEGEEHLASIAARHNRAEVLKHWFAVMVIAPARYRRALHEAIGEVAGDDHFYGVAKVPEKAYQTARRAGFYGL